MSKIIKCDGFKIEISDIKQLINLVNMKLVNGIPLTEHERAFIDYFYDNFVKEENDEK